MFFYIVQGSMKIGIYIGDTNPRVGGGSTILRTIQNELKQLNMRTYEFFFLYSGGRKAEKNKIIDGIQYHNIDTITSFWGKLKHKIYSFVDRKKSFQYCKFDVFAKLYSIDVFWLTTPITVDISYPFIYTVWDLGHRSSPYFPEVSKNIQWEIREERYSLMIPKATYVLTGNETGKKEILDNYRVPPDKIQIVPFPISQFCYGEEKKPSFEVPKQYFFYPAQFWPHKNHICILEAVSLLKKNEGINPVVFFTGSDKGNKEYIISKVKEYDIEENIIITGFLEEKELKYLYTHATAMIFASLLGPNNLPPIEATYLNCPVIITDLAGHKEQLGDSALYFDGYRPDELAKNMKLMLEDKKMSDELKKKQSLMRKDIANINYSKTVLELIDKFQLIRNRWE